MLTMARKRKPGAGRPKGTEPPRKPIYSFKGTEEFKRWLDGLVEHCRSSSGWSGIPISGVIERALIEFARSQGYPDPPPER